MFRTSHAVQKLQLVESKDKYEDEVAKKQNFERYAKTTDKAERLKLWHEAIKEGWVY
jgi:hypothetical protein